MWPIPDVGELYAIASRISAHADQTRLRGTRLRQHVQHLQWQGPAADAFAPLAAEAERSLFDTATRLDAAATRLRRHAHAAEDAARRLQELAVEVGLDVVEVMRANEAGSLALLNRGSDVLGSVVHHGGAGIVGSLLGIGR